VGARKKKATTKKRATTKKKPTTKKKRRIRDKKAAFVVSIIGKKGSKERAHADTVLKEIIKPALNLGDVVYDAKRIDSKGGAGSITQAIVESLLTADLVVVDLTGLNSNVIYEMGIRHAWDLPAIPIIKVSQLHRLPFDIKDIRTVLYNLRGNKDEAIRGIREQVRSIRTGEAKNTMFQQAMATLGRKHSIDCVYEAFKGAVNDMNRSLEDIRHEMDYDDAWRLKKDRDYWPGALERIFRRMLDKIHVFEQIAKGNVFIRESLHLELVGLLRTMRGVTQAGYDIVKVIKRRGTLARKRKQVIKRTDSILDKLKKIGAILPHKE